jgi:DNA (cytosine-5)-methyltransferase 1
MQTADIARLIESISSGIPLIARELGRDQATIYRWKRGQTSPSKSDLTMLRRMATGNPKRADGRPDFRFIDLFAGIGGLRLGVESAGGRCVFTCERDRFARRTYEANFQDGPDHPFATDIRTVDPEAIPAHDLLLAGFPCQPFSIAGVSKKNALGKPHGFSCLEQGNLFFNIADILAVHRPAAFILENVKNLCSHDGGRTFARIKETLSDTLNYTISTRVINARSFVPQSRERIFIVGFSRDVGFSMDDVVVPDPTMGPRLNTVLHSEDGSEAPEEPFTKGSLAKVSERYILTDHLWSYLQGYAEKHRAMGNGFGFGLVRGIDVSRTLSARYYKDGSEILIARGRKNPRRLTPRECARLMGFDRGNRRWNVCVSDTQAYKQFGNSVVVPVVEAVASAVVPALMRQIGGEQMALGFTESARRVSA